METETAKTSSKSAAVQLGFIEPIDPENPLIPPNGEYDPSDLPNKVGSKPIWLNPECVLPAEALLCGVCSKVMVLLLQLYTPEDHPPEAFHRAMYLFVCKNGACLKKDPKTSVKVFRSQLPEENKFTGGSDFAKAQTCRICGLHGPKRCGKCQRVNYCSREHQVYDWCAGGHKHNCSNPTPTPASGTPPPTSHLTFPEYEIVSEDEPPSLATPSTLLENLSLTTPTISEDDDLGVTTTDPEAYEDSQVGVDKAFLKFQKRIERDPEQVLRYGRVSYGDEENFGPLWVSEKGRPKGTGEEGVKEGEEDVPVCPNCGKERTFEFQVMPQLLNHLNVDHFSPSSLDWGSLLIFSCPNNCVVASSTSSDASESTEPEYQRVYMQEVVWCQNFSEDGMNSEFKKRLEGKMEQVEE
ncbi:Programmed cell death protein 2 [Quaeritorhiza haematococci]|nr:Programmed cell death protein 2 [Quaeritorhiza haematococci]